MPRPKHVYDPFDGSYDNQRSTEPERKTALSIDEPSEYERDDHRFVESEDVVEALGLAHRVERLGASSLTIRGTRLA